MNIEKLCTSYNELLQYMENNHYSANYIKQVEWEIKWLCRSRDKYKFSSYIDIYNTRFSTGRNPNCSESRKYHLRSMYTMLQRFEEDGELPNRQKKQPLVQKKAYLRLLPAFKDVIDLYEGYAEKSGLKEDTIKTCLSKGSCFLLYMQKKGHTSLETIAEDDVLSFFTDDNGEVLLSSTYKRDIAAILGAELGSHTNSARRVLTFLPAIRKKRKNIKYLTSEEAESIRDTLYDGESHLAMRDRSIGMLLYFTGLRGCDIAKLRFENIDWSKDEIHLTQSKTGIPINLPLRPTVGNALYDYIVNERPKSVERHIFLGSVLPHDPISADTIWPISAKIYEAARVRQSEGNRRGSHLFRYHFASSLAEHGISQPVISETLGHEFSGSLDYYLAADMVHLRECALSIEDFPVGEEVLHI
jgi:integrase